MSQILQIAAIAVATLGTGAATLSVMNGDIPDLVIPDGDWAATGALDGMVFDVSGTDISSGAELTGEIVFRDGKFQSTDCQEYCDFGWTGYQTETIDGVIHWTTTIVCPDAPHTVVWYGQVTGQDVVLDATWTTRRWYWTNQVPVQATGTAALAEAVSG